MTDYKYKDKSFDLQDQRNTSLERSGICEDYWRSKLYLVVYLTFLYRKYKTFDIPSIYKSTSSNKHLKTMLQTRNQLDKNREKEHLSPPFWSLSVKVILLLYTWHLVGSENV